MKKNFFETNKALEFSDEELKIFRPLSWLIFIIIMGMIASIFI